MGRKRFGYRKKAPNFHNMNERQIKRWIARNRGSVESAEWMDEAYEWLSKKGATVEYNSEVLDSNKSGPPSGI